MMTMMTMMTMMMRMRMRMRMMMTMVPVEVRGRELEAFERPWSAFDEGGLVAVLVEPVVGKALEEDRDEEVHDDVVAKEHDQDRGQCAERRPRGSDRVVRNRVPVLRRDDLERDEERAVPELRREEGIEVGARRLRLDLPEVAAEVLHPEQRENVHEHDPDDGQRAEGADGDPERLEDLAHRLPGARKLEQPEQPHAAQRRDGGARARGGVEGVDDELEDGGHDDEKVELVELVVKVLEEPQPHHLDHHLRDEHKRQDRVDALEDQLPLRREVLALIQQISADVSEIQRPIWCFGKAFGAVESALARDIAPSKPPAR
eukprot:3355142-Rhodomonas_salina.3